MKWTAKIWNIGSHPISSITIRLYYVLLNIAELTLKPKHYMRHSILLSHFESQAPRNIYSIRGIIRANSDHGYVMYFAAQEFLYTADPNSQWH